MRPVSSILVLSFALAAPCASAAPGASSGGAPFGAVAARVLPIAPSAFSRKVPSVQARLRPGLDRPIGTALRSGTFRSPGFGRGCGPTDGFGGCRGGGDRGRGYGYPGLGFGYDLGYGRVAAGAGYEALPAQQAGVSGIRQVPVLPPMIYVIGEGRAAGETRREAPVRTEARAGGPLIVRMP